MLTFPSLDPSTWIITYPSRRGIDTAVKHLGVYRHVRYLDNMQSFCLPDGDIGQLWSACRRPGFGKLLSQLAPSEHTGQSIALEWRA